MATLMMKILFCSPFLLFSFSCYPSEIQATEIQFNTLDLSHLLSPVTCDRVSKTGGLKNRLQVVHRHGPCAHDSDSKQQQVLNNISILANDQKRRVNSIQARTKLPARSGDFLGSGYYIVAIGLGTPKRRLYLIFDTGSHLTWTQCLPCLGHCYRQKNHIFNPSASTTYSNVPCNSNECSHLSPSACHRSNSTTCTYDAKYGDASYYTSGFYSRDTLTVTHDDNDVFRNFLFGCSQNTSESFSKAAGVLGLSRGSVSFVSQTTKMYSSVFSYCFPSDIRSSTGFLTFGREKYNNNNKVIITTPFGPDPQGNTFYYIEITGISVGGTRLPITESVFKTASGVIDSGTTFTALPPTAYDAARKEFKKQTGKVFKYKIAPGRAAIGHGDILDTCFDIDITNSKILKMPTMSITFKGNATLHLDPSGILYVVNSTLACFAFARNADPTDFAVFGSTQQLNYQVTYDVPGNLLGFQSNPNCEY